MQRGLYDVKGRRTLHSDADGEQWCFRWSSTFLAHLCDISSVQREVRRVVILVQDRDDQRDLILCYGPVHKSGNAFQLQGLQSQTVYSWSSTPQRAILEPRLHAAD